MLKIIRFSDGTCHDYRLFTRCCNYYAIIFAFRQAPAAFSLADTSYAGWLPTSFVIVRLSSVGFSSSYAAQRSRWSFHAYFSS